MADVAADLHGSNIIIPQESYVSGLVCMFCFPEPLRKTCDVFDC